jgi:hypothetical protein
MFDISGHIVYSPFSFLNQTKTIKTQTLPFYFYFFKFLLYHGSADDAVGLYQSVYALSVFCVSDSTPGDFIYRYTSEQRGKEERNKTNKSDVEEEGRRNIGKAK